MPIQKLIVVGMRFQPEAKKFLAQLPKDTPPEATVITLKLEDNKEATGGKAYAVYACTQRFTSTTTKLGYIREADLATLKSDFGSRDSISEYKLTQVFENYLVLRFNSAYDPFYGVNKPFNEVPIETRAETYVTGIDLSAKFFTQTSTLKDKEMTMFEKIVNANKTVAVTAAYMEAGRVANNQVTKLVAAKAPLMVRGYVDTPIGKLVLANLTAMAVEQFRPTDQKLKKVANAMMSNAYQELIQLVDIEGMINELVSSDGIKKALAAVEGQEIQT